MINEDRTVVDSPREQEMCVTNDVAIASLHVVNTSFFSSYID